MTKEEKNDMYRKNLDKHIKGRKSKIISLAVVPVIGIVLTIIISAVGSSRQSELSSATVLDTMSVGEFLAQNGNGSAIYNGTIRAVNPVSIRQEGGEYIYIRRTVEQVQKIYDKESDKYETQTNTISDDRENCQEIEIDDVVVSYSSVHSLPSYGQTDYEGPNSNQFKIDVSYTPATIDGTFFIKCKDGEVSSVQYFESADVSGESKRAFDIAKIIIWIFIIAIEIYLVVDVIKTGKTIKIIEGKIAE